MDSGNRLLVVALVMLAGACSAQTANGTRPTGSCSTNAECVVGAQCIDHRCVTGGGLDGAVTDAGGAGPADGGVISSPDGGAADAACVGVESAAQSVERPADIILMVDSTGSMGPAVARIEAVINSSFATVIGSSGIDYQVILIASDVTIGPPLSTSGRLHTLDLSLGSSNGAAFKPVLDHYADWSGWLRPDAIKIFLHFTDSNDSDGGSGITGYSGTFDQELIRMDPAEFGTAGDPRIIYNAIVGLAPNTPVTNPYVPPVGVCDPGDPIVTTACTSSQFSSPPHPGAGFQMLAMRTGGLRFSVCEFDHFDVVFNQIAQQVIDSTSAPCSFHLPPPPDGETLNTNEVALRFSPTGSDPWQVFRKVDDPSACDSMSFTITGDQIDLCPAACAVVQCSPSAQIKAVAGCDPSLL